MQPLILQEHLGSGSQRDCWVHPGRPDLCVKTIHSQNSRNQNQLDYDYYQWLKKRGKSGAHFPALLGWCITDKGPGLIFERIINADMQPSLNLKDSLEQKQVTPAQASALVKEMFQSFLAEGLSVYDGCPTNFLVCIQADHMRLVAVDGIGHRNQSFKSRLRDRFPLLSRLKTLTTRHVLLQHIATYARETPPHDAGAPGAVADGDQLRKAG